MFSIAGGSGHCNDKVWGCTGSSWAENPEAAGGEPKLAYEDCNCRGCWY